MLGDEMSRTVYDKVVASYKTCSDWQSVEQDKGVNHPDYYDAWMFHGDVGGFSVSIKDKSVLGKTFVVLRLLTP